MPNLKQQVNASGTQAILGLGTLEQIKFNADGSVEIPNLPAKLDTANAFGVGQAWQDVTASRALNTTYTNTSGKPMAVTVYLNGSGTDITILFYVNNAVINKSSINTPSSDPQMNIFCIVPDGATYKVVGTGGDTLAEWKELR